MFFAINLQRKIASSHQRPSHTQTSNSNRDTSHNSGGDKNQSDTSSSNMAGVPGASWTSNSSRYTSNNSGVSNSMDTSNSKQLNGASNSRGSGIITDEQHQQRQQKEQGCWQQRDAKLLYFTVDITGTLQTNNTRRDASNIRDVSN